MFDGQYNDEIFLLSVDEYLLYKKQIPLINNWWWLRTPADDTSDQVCYVRNNGTVCTVGHSVDRGYDCVRPALMLANKHNVGERLVRYDFPWIVIDSRLAIAEVPIGFLKFDDKSNVYATSFIRDWLHCWRAERA